MVSLARQFDVLDIRRDFAVSSVVCTSAFAKP